MTTIETEEDVRIGILSTRHVHTDAYAEILAALDDAEFVGIAAKDDEDGQETAARHGTAYMETDDLLSQVDGVVICSPNATHIEWVRHAAAAGVDVLCEKPLAPEYETAREIVTLCEDAEINAGVCMPLRFSPLARTAYEDYRDETIGDLRYITGTNRGKMPGGWFIDPTLAGGGAVMDHTVHILNLVRWLTGLEVSEVYAETDTLIHDIPVEDMTILSMELEDGTPFTLDGSWNRPDEWNTWGDVTLELLGTDGAVGFDSTNVPMKVTRDSGDNAGIHSLGFEENSNERLIQDFTEAVAAGRDPLTSVQDGATEVAVIEATYESTEREEPVKVQY